MLNVQATKVTFFRVAVTRMCAASCQCTTGLDFHFFGGSKLLLPGARPGSKTNFVVAKLYVHFLRNENILIL